MLLVHQVGTVRIGEVLRYTVTYTPSKERVLPIPSHLHLRIRNTAALPFRAAYIVGPYNLYVAAYPASFNPDEKLSNPKQIGVPDFESNLRAGGSWTTQLAIPPDIRADLSESLKGDQKSKSVSWVIEIVSQVLFSRSASVSFDLVIGRDESSLDLVSTAASRFLGFSTSYAQAGQVSDFLPDRPGPFHELYPHTLPHIHLEPRAAGQPGHQKGVFSRAINVQVEDTAVLWNKPALPGEGAQAKPDGYRPRTGSLAPKPQKQKKVHLVILTHGLHSNLGADMLYIKERIDSTAQAVKEKRARERAEKQKDQSQDEKQKAEEDDDDEEIIVRGFPGNASRTERGIQYLGKRVAKYILHLTYPSQPYLPIKEALRHKLRKPHPHFGSHSGPHSGSSHSGETHSSATDDADAELEKMPYKFTSISFIGHSLGGLVQLYAIAYIQKYSPEFFTRIKPVNFICMASPLLGLSNENPVYVRFALDFGLVGRTGQDLGLIWRAPTLGKKGWSAVMNGLGAGSHGRQQDPHLKPLLRILPTGLAHQVLQKFKRRTLYSNVVNDGIVPLRTSCLLFLDWKGLGKVEKAQREAGLITTMAGWGWNELMGLQSSSPNVRSVVELEDENEGGEEQQDQLVVGHQSKGEDSGTVPQPKEDATNQEPQVIDKTMTEEGYYTGSRGESRPAESSPFDTLMSFFRLSNSNNNSGTPTLPNSISKRDRKIIKRSQTLNFDSDSASPSESQPKGGEGGGHEGGSDSGSNAKGESKAKSKFKAAASAALSAAEEAVAAPPKTTIFESAGDILNPPIPPPTWIINPATRDKGIIFHDRIYHPEDIPPPPPPPGSAATATKSWASQGFGQRPPTTPSKTPTTGTTTPTVMAAVAAAERQQQQQQQQQQSFGTDKEVPGPAPSGSSVISAVSDSAPSSAVPGADAAISASSTFDSNAAAANSSSAAPPVPAGNMRVEEKIARAYHRDLAWRKVLVRLEPEAHNNINVRRMFANAYGWPVVKHLCDMHFGPQADSLSELVAGRSEAGPAGTDKAAVTQSEPSSPVGKLQGLTLMQSLDGTPADGGNDCGLNGAGSLSRTPSSHQQHPLLASASSPSLYPTSSGQGADLSRVRSRRLSNANPRITIPVASPILSSEFGPVPAGGPGAVSDANPVLARGAQALPPDGAATGGTVDTASPWFHRPSTVGIEDEDFYFGETSEEDVPAPSGGKLERVHPASGYADGAGASEVLNRVAEASQRSGPDVVPTRGGSFFTTWVTPPKKESSPAATLLSLSSSSIPPSSRLLDTVRYESGSGSGIVQLDGIREGGRGDMTDSTTPAPFGGVDGASESLLAGAEDKSAPGRAGQAPPQRPVGPGGHQTTWSETSNSSFSSSATITNANVNARTGTRHYSSSSFSSTSTHRRTSSFTTSGGAVAPGMAGPAHPSTSGIDLGVIVMSSGSSPSGAQCASSLLLRQQHRLSHQQQQQQQQQAIHSEEAGPRDQKAGVSAPAGLESGSSAANANGEEAATGLPAMGDQGSDMDGKVVVGGIGPGSTTALGLGLAPALGFVDVSTGDGGAGEGVDPAGAGAGAGSSNVGKEDRACSQ